MGSQPLEGMFTAGCPSLGGRGLFAPHTDISSPGNTPRGNGGIELN